MHGQFFFVILSLMSREELSAGFKGSIEILQSVKDRCKVLSETWEQFNSFLTQLESLQDHQLLETQGSNDTDSKQSMATVNETTSDRKMRFQEVSPINIMLCIVYSLHRSLIILTSKLQAVVNL